MFKSISLALLFISCFLCCQTPQNNNSINSQKDRAITKLEMHLSAFGVESDNFPSIDATIDFVTQKTTCHRWYYNPAFKDSTYALSPQAMDTLYHLLASTDFAKLKGLYETPMTDQPTSTTIIIRPNKDTVTIKDYGLIGEYPLQKMYKIVYRLHLL
jgi:hypothetical protein